MNHRCLFVLFILSLSGCQQKQRLKVLHGYAVYYIPNNVRFVETKGVPDTAYSKHFMPEEFLTAFSFDPDCRIEEKLSRIKVDTLFDEDPRMQEYSSFMRKPLVFPAVITIYDTTQVSDPDAPVSRFRMIYKGKYTEFRHTPFRGVVIDIEREKE